jgi:hypothetical protein
MSDEWEDVGDEEEQEQGGILPVGRLSAGILHSFILFPHSFALFLACFLYSMPDAHT